MIRDDSGAGGRAVYAAGVAKNLTLPQNFKRCYNAFGCWLEQTGHVGVNGFRPIGDVAGHGTWGPKRRALFDQTAAVGDDPETPSDQGEGLGVGERGTDMGVCGQ